MRKNIERVIRENTTFLQAEKIIEFFKQEGVFDILDKVGFEGAEEVSDSLDNVEDALNTVTYNVRKLLKKLEAK